MIKFTPFRRNVLPKVIPSGVINVLRRFFLLFYDTYTDVDTTNLTAHTPDIDSSGTGYVKAGGATGDITIQSNRAFYQDTNIAIYVNQSGVKNANTSCIVKNGGGGNGGRRLGIATRVLTSTDYWRIAVDGVSTGRFRIVEVVGGVDTVRAQSAGALGIDQGNKEYTINASVHSTSITASLNGDVSLSIAYSPMDTQLTQTNHGIIAFQNNTTNRWCEFDNLKIEGVR